MSLEEQNPVQVRVFRTLDGQPVDGNSVLPVSEASWSLSYNGIGSISVSVPMSDQAERFGLREKVRPWKHTVALVQDGHVLTAGPVTARAWDGEKLSITATDGWGLWKKRLVLNHNLDAAWVDGEVLVDEDNPAENWMLKFAGLSLAGIGAGLVRESLKWGGLLVDTPTPEAGSSEKAYQCWDFATVYDRLKDLTALVGGPYIRWPARLVDGVLHLAYEANPTPQQLLLSTTIPGHHVQLSQVDEDSDSICTEAFGLGGRNDDVVLVARDHQTDLEAADYPLAQAADTSHSSVSDLTTLRAYLQQVTSDGSTKPEDMNLKVSTALGIQPGDLIDLATDDPYLGRDVQELVVSKVSGDLSGWATVDCFPREVG